MLLSVEVADPIAKSLSLNGPSSTRRVLEMLAREGKLSRGQVSDMLDLEFNETGKFLKDHGAMLGLSDQDYDRSNLALRNLISR